jgi:hypothetical protein
LTALAVALTVLAFMVTVAGIRSRHSNDSMLELIARLFMGALIFIGALAMAFASAMTQAVQTFPTSVKWHYDLYSRKEAK